MAANGRRRRWRQMFYLIVKLFKKLRGRRS